MREPLAEFKTRGCTACTDRELACRVAVTDAPRKDVSIIHIIANKEADTGKSEGLYGDVPVYFLGIDQYIANKRAVGWKKDLAELESLGEE